MYDTDSNIFMQNIQESLLNISDQLNEKPGSLFHQQKMIEYEWQSASSSIHDFQEQINKWMKIFKSLMDKFKELGSIQTLIENLERRMTIVAHTIQHKN